MEAVSEAVALAWHDPELQARAWETYLMVLPVRRRIHCGIGRFCFCFLARICLVRKVLWEGCMEKRGTRYNSSANHVTHLAALLAVSMPRPVRRFLSLHDRPLPVLSNAASCHPRAASLSVSSDLSSCLRVVAASTVTELLPLARARHSHAIRACCRRPAGGCHLKAIVSEQGDGCAMQCRRSCSRDTLHWLRWTGSCAGPTERRAVAAGCSRTGADVDTHGAHAP